MNIRFDDRPVIVTGAAHGFGRAIACAFSGLGARVWACDILEQELFETRACCDGGCHTRVVDVSDRDAVQRFVAEVLEHEGSVHALVNNAGGVHGQVGKPLEAVTESEWRDLFEINVSATFWFSQAVAPTMKRAGVGRIVNISSGAGLGVSLTGIQAYASSKAAQIGLTRQLAHELGPFGITVNNIAPGFVRSNPSTERQWDSYGAEGQQRLVASLFLRRLGSAADIANAVLFFASDYAGWITGQVLSVNGGR